MPSVRFPWFSSSVVYSIIPLSWILLRLFSTSYMSAYTIAWCSTLRVWRYPHDTFQTLLYWLNQDFGGCCQFGHNDTSTLIIYWILPNGWVCFCYRALEYRYFIIDLLLWCTQGNDARNSVHYVYFPLIYVRTGNICLLGYTALTLIFFKSMLEKRRERSLPKIGQWKVIWMKVPEMFLDSLFIQHANE